MSAKKILIGVLAGAAAGAVLGILFAPAKGSTTRAKFQKRSYNYSEELEEKFNELIDSIAQQFETVVEDVNRMAELDKLKSKNKKS